MPRQTRRAVATNAAEPFDAYAVTDLQVGALTASAHLDDLANTLVATDLVGLRGVRQRFPAVGHDAQIGVADSRMCAFIILVSIN